MIAPFELSRPEELSEALHLVADGAIPLVGGTELVAAMAMGLVTPEHVVDLKRVPDLSGIREQPDGIVIGSTTRHADIARSELIRTNVSILADACSLLGNQRVRATGTIGGNLCFADPRSDVATALFALRAEVLLRSSASSRTVPVGDFILGAMESDVEEGEILEAVRVPVFEAHQVYVRHQPSEYPTVCVAVVQPRDPGDGPLLMAIGAVGDRPHVISAESADDIDLVSLLADVEMVEDLNGSEEYKRHLAVVFGRRALAQLEEMRRD